MKEICCQCKSYLCKYFKDDFGTYNDIWCKKHPEKEIDSHTRACEDFERGRTRAMRSNSEED